MAQNLPATKGLQPDLFVLVLNGTRAAPWSGLAAKVSAGSVLGQNCMQER